MKFNLKEKKENIKEEIDEEKENENLSIPKSVPIQKETKKYGETICKIAGKNTLLEFTTNGFNLAPKDKEGNRKELSCHISMNFVEYDDNFRQTKYIPFYLLILRQILAIIINVILGVFTIGIVPLINLLVCILQKDNKCIYDLICKTEVIDGKLPIEIVNALNK